jgi:hypothetical protein
MVDLVLAGNGPGELAGWIRPVAAAARRARPGSLRVTLALTPTQFAGGREPAVARAWGLFDRVLDPAQAVRVALGLQPLETAPSAVVVHLGGDLWFSARLARRLRAPACALVETPLVARRHRAFEAICAVSEDLAAQLAARGVPAGKVVVTGDPRADALAPLPPSPSPQGGEGHPCSPQGGEGRDPVEEGRRDGGGEVVSFLPGSRDRFARVLAPYFLQVADALAAMRPGVRFQVIASAFLSTGLIAQLQRLAEQRWPAVPVRWVVGDPWDSLRRSALTVTIPGTNTVELALLGVPFAVVVPLDLVDRAPAEGLLEWAGRLPGLGRLLKRAAAAWYFRRRRLVALPNIRAGRPVVPEWVGRFTAADLAQKVAELLDDRGRCEAMSAELRQLYPAQSGAAARVAACALALARGPGRRS